MDLLLKIPIVSKIFKNKILKALGLADAKVAMTGAAITPVHVKEWFGKLGIHLIEVYGMTEVCGPISAAPQLNAPVDSVGKVVPFCEVKIEKNTGEVLMKSPFQMEGYFKEEEKTAEIVKDGWIYSGDKGVLDENGFLKIIGRVKDAFKTAKGKYLTPNPIEEIIMKNEWVEQTCVVGLGCPQPLALINLSEAGLNCDKGQLETSLNKTLSDLNADLTSFEKVSTIVITDEVWSESNDLLTPTLKVRRGSIDEKYSSLYLDWHDDNNSVIWQSQ